MATQIALLRGINVGSHNRVAMADLRALLAGLGYEGARTLLQSGNVVLDAPTSPADLAAQLEATLAAKLGVRARVLVRTRAELAAVLALNPLGDLATSPKLYQVYFLSRPPPAKALRALAALDFSPERYVHASREIYAWHPTGIQRSPLAKLLSDRHLGVTVTARNWSTATKLLQLADEHQRTLDRGR
jgi:uncharacterized protein (DUF1697 family)